MLYTSERDSAHSPYRYGTISLDPHNGSKNTCTFRIWVKEDPFSHKKIMEGIGQQDQPINKRIISGNGCFFLLFMGFIPK